MPSDAPRILEWYRADPWPGMRRVLVIGPAILTLGGLVIAVSFLSRVSHDVRVDTATAGFILITSGALATIFGMGSILRDDSYVALRTDGLAVRRAGRETLVAWGTLVAARWDPARSEVVLERADADGPPIAFAGGFARATGAEVAERIEQTRRRAALNMLR
jgi:hypothetical protein